LHAFATHEAVELAFDPLHELVLDPVRDLGNDVVDHATAGNSTPEQLADRFTDGFLDVVKREVLQALDQAADNATEPERPRVPGHGAAPGEPETLGAELLAPEAQPVLDAFGPLGLG